MAEATVSTIPRIGWKTTLRISNIPTSISRVDFCKYLGDLAAGGKDHNENTSSDSRDNLLYLSLAPSPSGHDSQWFQVATATFKHVPHVTGSTPVELGPPHARFQVDVDTHFRGLTQLNDPTNPTVDIIAVTGLAGHAFGSWRSQEGPEMWLRDFLPDDLKRDGCSARILTYGYDTQLAGSVSDAGIYDLSKQFLEAVRGVMCQRKDPIRPIILIGHSLGGLLVKQTIIESRRSDQDILASCSGMLFFGVPNRGLTGAHLISMVKGQPNHDLVRDLCGNSEFLGFLDREFCEHTKSLAAASRIISFYETKDTKTVEQKNPGQWTRSGPYVRMVTRESVLHAVANVKYIPLDADHSTLVKFNCRSDQNYQIVRCNILELTNTISGIAGQSKMPSKERMKVFKWLYPDAVDLRHIEISGKRQQNTGWWLFREPKFLAWMDNSGRLLLWGCGIPGAGKTFLSSLVIDELERCARSIPCTGVAYIYFNYKEQDQQTPVRILRSLIKQLGTRSHALSVSLPEEVQALYDQNYTANKTPKLQDLKEALVATSKLFTRVFFVFDALDECEENRQRKELLPLIHWLVRSGASIFLTSRPYPRDIAESLSPTASDSDVEKVELEAKEEDVRIYIEETIKEHPHARNLIKGDFRHEVVSKLVDCCKGMFLLIHFYIEDLCQYTMESRVRRALDDLTSTLGTEKALNGTYSRAMDSIRSQQERRAELAMTVLTWLVKARRTLTVDELRMAVAMGDGTLQDDMPPFNEADMPDATMLLEVCFGLVIIDGNSNTIQLAHYSVQEYLERSSVINGSAELDLAVALGCIDCLWLSFNEPGRLRKICGLIDYAALYLHSHLQVCHKISPIGTLLKFLRNTDLLEYYAWARVPLGRHKHGYTRDEEAITSPLHEASGWGNSIIVDLLLREGANISLCDRFGRTALHVAAEEGIVHLAQLLLENGADLESSNMFRCSPLYSAVYCGSVAVARVLLNEGADMYAEAEAFGTILAYAVSIGDIDMTQLMFSFGADVGGGGHSCTLLHVAARGGQVAMARFLLGNGARVDASTFDGQTPLHLAATRGYVEMAQFLLDNGADKKARGENGETLLHATACGGNVDLAQLVLDIGADIHARDNHQKTPLHTAAIYGSTDMTSLLIDKGADIHSRDINQMTPLHHAVRSDIFMADMVRLLVDKGADIHSRDINQMTPLHFAAQEGSKNTTSLLTDKGADIHSRDINQMTPLHHAVRADIFGADVVRLLVDKGADIHSRDISQMTPLHHAARVGTFMNADTVSLLVDKGADIHSRDINKMTPLHHAARVGTFMNADTVSLLIDKGADIHSRDINQMTPLHFTAQEGSIDRTSLLIGKGASIGVRDINRKTTLHYTTGRRWQQLRNWFMATKPVRPPLKSSRRKKDVTR